MPDWRSVRSVPYDLHILHHITGDSLESLPGFAAVKPRFRVIAYAMEYKYIREVVQAACFDECHAFLFSCGLESWGARLIELRPGPVVACAEKLEAVRVSLQ